MCIYLNSIVSDIKLSTTRIKLIEKKRGVNVFYKTYRVATSLLSGPLVRVRKTKVLSLYSVLYWLSVLNAGSVYWNKTFLNLIVLLPPQISHLGIWKLFHSSARYSLDRDRGKSLYFYEIFVFPFETFLCVGWSSLQ